jgi:hypothetical protein
MPNILYDPDMAFFEVESAFAQYPVPSGGTGVTLAEFGFGVMGPGPLAIDIGNIIYHPSLAVTPSNAAYSVLNIFKRTGAGGPVLLASINNSVSIAPFNTGSWAAFIPVTLTLATTPCFVSPSDVLTVSVTNGAGAGLTFPGGVIGVFGKTR